MKSRRISGSKPCFDMRNRCDRYFFGFSLEKSRNSTEKIQKRYLQICNKVVS